MNTVEQTVAAALARFQADTDALLRLRLALAIRKQAKHRTLRRMCRALGRRLRQALGSRRKDKPAPEMSGVRTVCWHPADRLARRPASLPSDAVADTWMASNASPGRSHSP